MHQRPDIEAIYPLSPMQQGMLFHILADGGSPVYFSQTAWTLPESFDVEALKLAWQEVFERHPVLRTAFTWKGLEQPLQVVHRRLPLPWEEHDWRDLIHGEYEARLESFLEGDRQRGFELTRAPVVRLSLIRLPQGAFAFVWSYSHLLLDGWSSRLVMREILDFWEALRQGRQLRLPPSRPYKDYISWLKTQDLAKAENYWRRTLADFVEPTPLPGAHAQAAEPRVGRSQSGLLREEKRTLGRGSALSSFARSGGLTLNTLIQGAWALLLSRHCGLRKVIFGATVSGRPPSLPGAETIAGLFINTLPIRIDIEPNEPVGDWLARLQEDQALLRQYDYSPLVRIREWSGVPAEQPLFASLLVFENYPVDKRVMDGGGLGIREFRSFESSNYPLNVIVSPAPDLEVAVHYDSGRFETTEIRRLLRQLGTLLHGFVARPGQRIAEVPILTPAERHQVRVEWNGAGAANPEAATLHELFATQAARSPDAVAVASADVGITFRELDRRSQRLAHQLRRLGVTPETRVGLAARRSLEGILGRLSILRAGGCFVPLDVSQPRQRLGFLVRDAGLAMIMAEGALQARVAAAGVPVVTFEATVPGPSMASDGPSAIGSKPEGSAYAIYTSGSTGRPKGVLVSHSAVTHLAQVHAQRAAIGPASRVLHLASPGFDVSVQETLASLCVGATVCLGSVDELMPGPALGELLGRLRVSVLMLTPAVLSELPVSALPHLRTLIVGGEACRNRLAALWAAGRRLLFEYGPTEATVTATAGFWDDGGRVVDAGRPLAGVGAPVCAADGSLAAPGARGEICISGPGLARGYLGRPAQTAAAFVPDSLGGGLGTRLYRTGDLGRWRTNGRLEILGRLDHQVKVRGVRVEPGEIEAVLRRLPAVGEAVVVARPSGAGELRLVAYLTSAKEAPPTVNALRQTLRKALPEPMVPTAFVILESLPLNPSGKVDRRALPEPEARVSEEVFAPPRGPIEEMVAEIFAEVLGNLAPGDGRIGREADFLELGGHSLLAVRLVSRIRQSLAVEIGLREVFEHFTVAALARRIEAAQRSGIEVEVPPIRPLRREGPRPLSFAQERLWFLDQLSPGSPAYNMPLALRLEGALDVGALARAFSEIVRRHEVLRTRFPQRDGAAVQEIEPAASVPLPRVDLGDLPAARREATARELARREALRPFDLEQGPLLHAVLVRLGAGEHLLLATFHHIVTDGWSMQILVRELSVLYRALRAGHPSPLEELAVQYADYAVWQRQWLAGEIREKELDYWRRQLADGGHVLELPTDRPRRPSAVRSGAQVPLALKAEPTAGLLALGRRRGGTIFMTLLAAFQTLLRRYSGQGSISIGTPVAGRHRLEIEELIGFFVNTLVLRTELAGDPTFEDLLAQVREVTLGAYAHQDLPFEVLVDELQPARNLSHSPLFQVMLSLLEEPEVELELPGLKLSPLEIPAGAAKFDLTLEIARDRRGLNGVLRYPRDLFDHTTVQRMARHLENLLAGIALDPQRRLSQLPWLTAAQLHEVTLEWNDTATSLPLGQCLHELIEAQVELTPETIAVIFEDCCLSYRELDRQANRLANTLRRLGVGPEARVGVCLERSLELVVALYAVIKSGGAYVPLDPSYPMARLDLMAEDSGLQVLLAQEGLQPILPKTCADVVYLDGERPISGESTLRRPVHVSPMGLAYSIYTSGSTGRPKGAMNAHRGVVNRLEWMQDTYRLGVDDRILQKTPFSFDVSVWEFFWPLLAGAGLVLARPNGHRDATYLARLIARQRVSMLHFVPSMLAAFLEADGLEEHCRTLRRVIVSGEALAPEILRRYRSRLRAPIDNLYGPTEAAVDVTRWPGSDGDGRIVPIGRPIANTGIHLLDRSLRPVPIGAPGELHIAGTAVGRGYCGRPALTAERFIPDDVSGATGARLYKTGDASRWLARGEVEFLGRLDDQVKVRGFRIELGEIESVLEAHPAVHRAVVTVREVTSENPGLVAYAVPDRKLAAPLGHLLRRLRRGELEGGSLYELPNGLTIAHLNRGETEFMYSEIFGQRTYLRHGVTLRDGDLVFDVGANVGLFSLFVTQHVRDARLFAFEPIPQVADLLRINLEIYAQQARTFPCGLSRQPGQLELTFYPHMSLMSGSFADAAVEREVVRSFVALQEEAAGLEAPEIEELLRERLAGERVNSEMKTISQIIREQSLGRIDLLKVDVEKSELDVLSGIDDGDWGKIHQVVAEVHDSNGRLEQIVAMLERHGLTCAWEQDSQLSGTDLYNVYAVRPEHRRAEHPVTPRDLGWSSAGRLEAELRREAGRSLPEYMVPSMVIFLDKLPLTPSGKVDRRALPVPELSVFGTAPTFVEPRSSAEQLVAATWSELLSRERIGAQDDFFKLGGHSLLATRMVSRLRRAFGVDLSLRELFESPTVEALARRIEELEREAGVPVLAILPQPSRAAIPLSFAQQRLWFIDQMNPGSAAYVVPSALRLRGRLDICLLQRTLSEVVRRHEILRTTFEAPDGKAVQIIAPPASLALPVVDLSALLPGDRRTVAGQLAREETARPFDLARGPVLRARLVRLADDEHLVLATAHHIVIDEQSMPILIGEVGALYAAWTEGLESPLPELPVQYADYAIWQRRRLDGEVLEAELAHWRRRLDGVPDLLELPTDRPRRAVRSDRGASWPLEVPAALSRSLTELGQRRGATLFMALVAAYKALLHHHTGRTDLCVGAPFEGRHHLELEGLIGFFVNLVPLRTDLSGDPTFAALLGRVRDGVLEAHRHQELPFERLVDDLGIRRHLSHTPLVQVAISLQNAPRPERLNVGLQLEPILLEDRSAKFDLTLSMLEAPEGLAGSLSYAAELFDATTIARFAGHLRTLLTSVAADPDQRLSQLTLFSWGERQQLLWEWNDVASCYPREASIQQLFDASVRCAPDAVAVVSRDGLLTYAELDRSANRLARHLLAISVGAEPRIGVCVEGAADIVLVALAALKVGGAYVPLDPGYPAERLAFMAEDAGLQALVTREALRADLPELPGLARVLLDAEWPQIASRRQTDPALPSSPDRLAYVIYTSGSTGRPKGICIPQNAVSRLILDTNYVEIAPTDRLAQASNISFDAATFEIWGALLNGATLVEIERQVALAPGALATALTERRISVLFVTTALFNQIARDAPQAFRVLRCLLFGGEAVDPTSVRRVLADGAPERLLHVYGPTENTTFSSWHAVTEVAESASTVPIGGPICNTTMYVLDRRAKPAPVGVTGELWLGGEGLARSYLARPALTAEAFVPDPFAGEGARLYRTGDLVRRLPGGAVEFVGRRDHQVKVRGFRIELGEIEAALTESPQVAEAAALLRRDGASADGRVVAYIVPRGEARPTTTELRKFLETRLPEYMVPQVFVNLERMPLTPNDKVDRGALPPLEGARPELEEAYVAPRSSAEERLAAVWSDVLGVAEIGVHDNFFELGGDSILTIQVATRAAQAGLRVTARQLFQHPTVAELAAVAEVERERPADHGVVLGAVPLTPVQRWFFELGNATLSHFNQSILLEVDRRADPARLEPAVARLLAYHDALRLRFARDRSGWRQEIAPPVGPAPASQLDLSRLSPARWQRVLEAAAAQVQASLDLELGPVIRFVRFDFGAAEPFRLLVVAHHLVIDGVSWRILLSDLESLLAGTELPPKTMSFKRWAEVLTERAESDAVRREQSYWSEEMWSEDLPDEALQLPVDLPSGSQANTVESAREATVTLGRDETRALLQEVPRVFGTRINHVLLTAFARACEAWTGHATVLLDLESHGRDLGAQDEADGEIDLSRTVGWFTAIYPVLLDLRGIEAPAEALAAVREQLERVPGGGIGYGLLRFMGERKTARWLRALPAAEVSFNYHGQVDQTLPPDSLLSLASESVGPSQAPQDLRPHLLEVGGMVTGGELRLTLTYSENLHLRETIETLGGGLIETLRELVAAARGGGSSPTLDLPPGDLENALAAVSFEGAENEEGVEDVYRLSPMQEGLLFHSVSEESSGFYVTQFACRLSGLDVETFAGTWQRVIDHEPVLRTAIGWSAGDRPIQAVGRRVELPLAVEDWSGLAPGEQNERFEALIRADRRRGFDLSRAPLMRLVLAREGGDTYRLLWSHHHILLDGWSVPLLLAEIFSVYGALIRGEEPRLARRRPYRDYIAWLESRDLAASEHFWRRRLRGFHVATPLFLERSRAEEAPAVHAEELRQLSRPQTRRLEEWARRRRLTASTVVQGMWAILLGRYSAQREVLFGSVESGRPHELAGVEGMIGLFINTLPVRAEVPAEAPIQDWLQAFQDHQAEQREHVFTPLAQIQKWSEVPPGQPLFETLVAFENYPLDASLGQGVDELAISDVRPLDSTHFPLTLTVSGPRELSLRLEFDLTRCSRTAARRLLGHLQNLLVAVTSDGHRQIGELPLLSAPERQQLREWNATAVAYPRGLTVHGLVEAQARRTPEATALVFEDEVLTYRELDRRAAALARRLRRLGVGPEARVGICVERSPELVVGLLGALEAGAAYVPLDPSYPEERLAFMLADSGIAALVTTRRLQARLRAPGVASVVVDCGTRILDDVAKGPEPATTASTAEGSEPGGRASADSLAYAIYTSGSTGRPKGAMNAHRGVVNRLLWMQQTYGLAAADRVLQKTPFSFDVSVWEFFWPLFTGAALVIARPEGHRDPDYLADLIAGERVTTLHFVPSMLRAFLEARELAIRCRSLRRVIASGEALPADLVERFHTLLGAELHNLYGPTEAAVDVTFEPCPADRGRGVVAIGRPVANTGIHLLDRTGEPVPVGVAGELAIGGVQVGRGYLGRPALTAKCFVPDAASPGGRLYRTGDLARYLPDGRVEFLGRIDFQVKIRGLRIELEEIEAVLSQVASVRRAVVVAREEASASTRLVAYVVPCAEPPSRDELRTELERRLPDYMVPSAFVFLDELPLTPSGKLDRRALPAPATVVPERERAFEAPRTVIERRLAAIWAEVLRVDRPGVHDDFFALGGDSILALQVVSRAARDGLRLTPRQLFDNPTVARLAAAAGPEPSIRAEQGPVIGPAPLTPIQQWFFEHPRHALGHFNQAVLLEVRRPLDDAVLAAAAARIVEHHDALRLRFEPLADGWRQRFVPPAEGPAVNHRIDLSRIAATRRAEALETAAGDVQASLDLERGPLVRFACFDLGPGDRQRWLVAAHHLAIDGVSWRILLEDLDAACSALKRRQSARLPAKTTSFRAWAERLAAWAGSQAVVTQASVWLDPSRSRLRPLPVDLDAPTDANTVASVDTVTVVLEDEESQALLSEVPRAYRARVDDALLAALVQAFGAWTGERRLLVDLESHGRGAGDRGGATGEELLQGVDLSRTVGWLTALYPVLFDLRGVSEPGEALREVKEALRRVPGGGLGYGLLRYLSPDRELVARLRALPAAEVSFNYLGQQDLVLPEGSLLAPAPESSGPAQSPRELRRYLVEIDGWVAQGKLRVVMRYSRALHHRTTIETLAAGLSSALRRLVAHCREAEPSFTPSDFPWVRLDQRQLDRVLSAVTFGDSAAASEIEDAYPLSPMQEGLLYHSLRQSGSGVYLTQIAGKLRGLDTATFAKAWQEVIDREPILRTAISWREVDRAIQVVGRRARLPVVEDDWSGLSAEEQEDRLARALAADRERGFDLARAPLMRLSLFRLDADTHQLIWSHHHVLLDGWSVPLVLHEVFRAYEALRNGEEARLAARRPYRDYILWLERQDDALAERFWRQRLHGVTAATPLGVDRPSGSTGSRREAGSEIWLTLPEAESSAVRSVAQRHRLTVSSVVQGAWAILLGRYSGEEEVIFGSVDSGRPADLPGVDTMVGLFINTLPVRVRLPAGEATLPWLDRFQRTQVEQREFAYAPLVEIQRWSEMPAGQPLFESFVAFENYPLDETLGRQTSLVLEDLRPIEATHFPLALTVLDAPSLVMRLEFDAGRFEPSTARRVCTHLRTLLRALGRDPHRALGELPLVSPAERQQLLYEWSDTRTPVAVRCLHEIVELQASRTPQAVAAACEGRQLTYGELMSRSSALACHLQRLGVVAETPVAICLERSLEMLVAALAVLRAGGAYVPLDPTYPAERSAYVLADSRASVLLSEPEVVARLRAPAGVALSLAPEWRTLPPAPAGSPSVESSPEQLAYVIYTSGSTGRPKGVEIRHHGVVSFLQAMARRPGLGPRDGLLSVTTLAFDIHVLELFLPLSTGGRVEIAPRRLASDGVRLARRLASPEVSAMQATPVTWQLLIESGWKGGEVAALCGGEALAPSLATELARRAGSAWNLYGPTETTVWSSVERLTPASRERFPSATVSIGRPIDNTEIYLLDARGRPLPSAAAGELSIGGMGLARGYRRRPALTAARFVPDPFCRRPGARLYRTGDLARFTADGRLEFHGRIDHQVKLRGFRIELGEIEAVLEEHRSVAEAVVVLRDTGPSGDGGPPRLIAYLVLRREAGSTPPTEELRQHLRGKLPDYMVPTAFVVLDEMPLTPNRKVDRRRLPAPEDADSVAGSAFTPPRTPLEEVLVSVWSQVLERDRIGVDESFFDLGGQSLLATRVVARLRDALGVELPIDALFEAPTVEALAREIEDFEPSSAPPPIARVARHGDLQPSFSQTRLWFLDRLEPGTAAYNLPFAVEIHGRLVPGVLRAALLEVVRRHEVLRTRFEARRGKPVQVVEPEPVLSFIETDLRSLRENGQRREAERIGRGEAAWSFRLDRLPLLRSVLLRHADGHWLLLLTIHHIVVDGWSFQVLLREVGALYEAFERGQPSPLAPLTLQYADYAAWQSAYLQGETLERQLAYWRRRLGDGGSPPLELPTDRPRPPLQTFVGDREPFSLSGAVAAKIQALARRESASVYMVLLAALSALLHRYTSQDDLSVGTFIAGRNRAELEDLIGFFVNTLVMRVDTGGDPPFPELLARARRVTLDAYAHQEIPFEKLIEELQPPRDMSRPAFYQVMLVLQNMPRATLELEELRLETTGSGGLGRANFDFTLWLAETDEGLDGYLDYNVDLFEAATVHRLLDHFGRLLEGVAERADRRLSELPLLRAEERRQVLVEWNDTGGASGWQGGVFELFQRQARQTPAAPALTWLDASRRPRTMSYGELAARTSRLARLLRRRGAGPDVLVAVCLDRSPELVVAVLAVLQVGSAYVPLDAAYAGERLGFMLRQSGARLLVTVSSLAPDLAVAGSDTEMLLLDAEEQSLAAESGSLPAAEVEPASLAYTVYTSGSTGRPKGVMVTHGALENAFCAWQERYRLRQETSCHLQMASFSFDVWSGDLVRALCSGGRLVLCPRELLLEPDALHALMVSQGVDAAEFVPAVARALVEQLAKARADGDSRDLAFMRLMVVGSDIWYMREMEALAGLCGPETRVINSYGVSEATIDTTSFELGDAANLHAERPVPIGRPFRGSRIYLLDAYRQPVPVGVPGELCLAGAGLARGYLASPALTAERFVPDPLALEAGNPPGSRLYRTGDRARYLPAGEVEFLGRIDDQVKVRGFRIEPGEVEAALEDLPVVRRAVVLARGGEREEKRLVAYVVPEEGTAPDISVLRAALGESLPDYMVPSIFVTLDALPLTPNGKVDRRALPEPDWNRPELATDYVAPRTASEEALAEIVQDLLGIDRVGIYDSFFDLGGHSLLATQFLARVREQFDVEVPLRAIFERPTVATLAVTVEEMILAELQELEDSGGLDADLQIGGTLVEQSG